MHTSNFPCHRAVFLGTTMLDIDLSVSPPWLYAIQAPLSSFPIGKFFLPMSYTPQVAYSLLPFSFLILYSIALSSIVLLFLLHRDQVSPCAPAWSNRLCRLGSCLPCLAGCHRLVGLSSLDLGISSRLKKIFRFPPSNTPSISSLYQADPSHSICLGTKLLPS
jgi:hypothetical protein